GSSRRLWRSASAKLATESIATGVMGHHAGEQPSRWGGATPKNIIGTRRAPPDSTEQRDYYNGFRRKSSMILTSKRRERFRRLAHFDAVDSTLSISWLAQQAPTRLAAIPQGCDDERLLRASISDDFPWHAATIPAG